MMRESDMSQGQSTIIRERLSSGIEDVATTRRETEEAERHGPSMDARAWPSADLEGARLQSELDQEIGGGNGNGGETETSERAWAAYEEFSAQIKGLASDDRWREKPIAAELLEETARLGDLMRADSELRDDKWMIRDALDQIEDLQEIMARKIERETLDHPAVATRFVIRQLRRIEPEGLARILDISEAAAAAGQSGESPTEPVAPERAVLVAQLVYDLRNSMTTGGVVVWFETPRFQLDGRTPLELLNDDVKAAEKPLRSLARAGRGQLAT
jgi:hypothetical protein